MGVSDSSGVPVSEARYTPFGELRVGVGINVAVTQTDFGYIQAQRSTPRAKRAGAFPAQPARYGSHGLQGARIRPLSWPLHPARYDHPRRGKSTGVQSVRLCQ